MIIRRLREQDAQAVSDLIITTIRISNVGDYPADLMEELVKTQTPEHILQRASWTHFYVAEDEDAIIGCGAIGPYWGKEDESSLFSIFVHPDYQGKGIGRAIVETLEKDEYALRARRIEIPASITGLPFYQRMGYVFKNGNSELDEEQLYRLEKYRFEGKNRGTSDMSGLTMKYNELTAEEFILLWETVWGQGPSLEQTRLAMEHTLFRVSVFDGNQIVAMARVIGDMGLDYYIKDVIVRPEYQGKGIGRMLINEILQFIDDHGIAGTEIFVELCAMPDKIPFYEKFGFSANEAQRLKLFHKVENGGIQVDTGN